MNITTTAHRWEQGWELWIDGEAATQVTTLDKAADQVRDYLDTIDPDIDHSNWKITVNAELGDLGDRVQESRAATAAAARAQEEAARNARVVAQALRSSGLSVTDTAAVLGVSRGRVSQLTAELTTDAQAEDVSRLKQRSVRGGRAITKKRTTQGKKTSQNSNSHARPA